MEAVRNCKQVSKQVPEGTRRPQALVRMAPPGSRGGTATWVVPKVGVALKMGEGRCWDGLRSDDFPRTRPPLSSTTLPLEARAPAMTLMAAPLAPFHPGDIRAGFALLLFSLYLLPVDIPLFPGHRAADLPPLSQTPSGFILICAQDLTLLLSQRLLMAEITPDSTFLMPPYISSQVHIH